MVLNDNLQRLEREQAEIQRQIDRLEKKDRPGRGGQGWEETPQVECYRENIL